MAFDSSLDKKLYSQSFDTDDGKITVSIFSYNNGPKKVQIAREILDTNGELKFAKLGRLTKKELASLIPILQDALTNL
jgi:predicted transcriptional regulator